jgi:hypothetical protein
MMRSGVLTKDITPSSSQRASCFFEIPFNGSCGLPGRIDDR